MQTALQLRFKQAYLSKLSLCYTLWDLICLFKCSITAFVETFQCLFCPCCPHQGQKSCYLKHEDKLRVSQSVFYLLLERTLKQPMASFYYNNKAALVCVSAL